MRQRAAKPPAQDRDRFDPVSVEEASDRHRAKWVLMEVTEFDEHRVPRKGIVRLASNNRRRITDESLRLKQAWESDPENRVLYVFYAMPDDVPAF